MTPSRTSTWGAVAGASIALQAIPDIPGWLRAACVVSSAVGVYAVGYHATDCPVSCPGTDALGRPRRPGGTGFMAALLLLGGFLALAWLVVACSGCTAVIARSYEHQGSVGRDPHKGVSLVGISFFDSGQVLGKTKLTYDSSTNGHWPGEVNISGVTQQSSSTGLVTIIQNFPKVVPVP